MKLSRSLILLLLISLLPLGAVEVTHLHMGLGNDWYTMGLGDNLDDGLSFGGHLGIAVDDTIFLKADALGFTDKSDTSHRYDQININLTSPISVGLSSFTVRFTPLVGVSLAGNFGFEELQNRVHDSLERPRVYLSYDSETTSFHPNLGATIQGLFSLGWIETGLEASYLHTFGWERSTQAVALLKLGNALTLRGGFSFMHAFTATEAHQSMIERMSGPTFSYHFDGGLVTTSWVYHKRSGSSYGVFGVDVMQLFQPATYDHTDFTYSISILYDMTARQHRSFSIGFGPVIMQTRHRSGPMINDYQIPRRRITVASWMLGYHKEWEATHLIYPYLKALWGFQRFNLHPSSTTASIETIKGTVALETGIRFGKDGQWVAKNNTYRPRIFTTIQYVFDVTALKEQDSAFADHVGPWKFFAGIGLDVGNDPH